MIEVGEYVRTKSGVIIQANWVGQSIITDKEDKITISKHDVVKHSKNIKKLIIEGDLVNGKEVYEFDDEEGTVLGIPIFEDGLFDTIDCYVPLDSIKIHSILTSEMYEANCYIVTGYKVQTNRVKRYVKDLEQAGLVEKVKEE